MNDAGLLSLNVAGLAFDPETPGRLHATTLGRGIFDFEIDNGFIPPFVNITSHPDPFTTDTSPIQLSGVASVTNVFWATNRGHAGFVTSGWSASVPLELGANVITVTAVDSSFNQGSDSITVTLTPTTTATTTAATNVTSTSATLNGTVNPNGLSTTAVFQWGTSTAYGSTTSSQPLGSGTTGVSVSADLTGFIPNTTYHYRVVASNSAGTTNGLDMTFTTPAASSQLTGLSPALVWVGLGASGFGIKFDLRAEAYVGTTLVGSGQVNSVPGGFGTGFMAAKLASIPLALTGGPVDVTSGSELKIAVLARNACAGSRPNSGTARLWFNGKAVDTGSKRDAGSRFGATIGSAGSTYFLKSGFALSTTAGATKQSVNAAVGAKCGPFVPFGTWSITLP